MFVLCSTVSRSWQLSWWLIMLLIPDISNACVIGKTSNPSKTYKTMKSVYYDLSTRQPLDIETDDTGRLPDLQSNMESKSSDCQCVNMTCGCCAGINIDYLNFDKETCANITLKPENLSADLDMSINGERLFYTTISGANPPPYCFPLYWIPIVTLCIRAHTLGIENRSLHACIDFETRIISRPIFILHFRCIKVGPGGTGWYDRASVLSMAVKPTLLLTNTSDIPLNFTHLLEPVDPEIYDEVTFEPDLIGQIQTNGSLVLTEDVEDPIIGTLKI